MNDMEPQSNLLPSGETDHEGAMARADLYKLANYSVKLYKKLDENTQLEAWVQAKITKAADYIASVYHYLEYEMEFSKFGSKLENSDMYSESEKLELKQKLAEAKEMLKHLKVAQAQKLEETKSPKAKKDWDGDGKIESDKDEVWGSRMKAAKKAGKMEESWEDDDEDDDVKKADSELKKRGVKLPAVKHKEVPIKKTSKDKEEELDEGERGDLERRMTRGVEKVNKAAGRNDKRKDIKKAVHAYSKQIADDPKLVKYGKDSFLKTGNEVAKKTAKDKEEEKLDEISQKTAVGYVKKVADNAKSNKDTFTDKRLKGVITAGNKVMGKPHAKVPATNEGSKPDFLDLDKDGNKKEPMKKAAKDKKLSEVSSDTLKGYQKKVIQRVLDKKEPVEKRRAGFDKAEKMIPKKEKGETAKSLNIDPSHVDSVKSDFKKLGKDLDIKNPTHHKMASTIAKKYQENVVGEAAPSAGLSAKKKSATVKKAKAGGDIGKPGKGFAKVEKAAKAGGAKDPKAVAAAAMWKNIKRESINESWDQDPDEHHLQVVDSWVHSIDDDVRDEISKLGVQFPISDEMVHKLANKLHNMWGEGPIEAFTAIVGQLNDDAKIESHSMNLRESAELDSIKALTKRLLG